MGQRRTVSVFWYEGVLTVKCNLNSDMVSPYM